MSKKIIFEKKELINHNGENDSADKAPIKFYPNKSPIKVEKTEKNNKE